MGYYTRFSLEWEDAGEDKVIGECECGNHCAYSWNFCPVCGNRIGYEDVGELAKDIVLSTFWLYQEPDNCGRLIDTRPPALERLDPIEEMR